MDSTFRVRFGQDSYPISRFIIERARTLGLSRKDIAIRLRYLDIGKAHRALDAALATGTVPLHMRRHLANGLETDDAVLDAVIAATLRQQQDEGRARLLDRERQYAASFRPHLRAETERAIPQPIFIAALLTTSRLRHVELSDEAWTAGPDRRDQLVKEAIRRHYREQRGQIPAFGSIVGYTQVVMAGYVVDFGFPYDTAGEPVGPLQAVKRLGEGTLGVKPGDTRLTGLLRETPIETVNIWVR